MAYAEKMRRALDPDRVAVAAWHRDRQYEDEDRCTMLQSIFTPDFARIFQELVLEPDDDLLYLDAAAAVAAWHREHGSLPPTLDGLLPYAPLYPFPLVIAGWVPSPGYEPAPDGRSFLLRPPFPSEKDKPVRFFLAPPDADTVPAG